MFADGFTAEFPAGELKDNVLPYLMPIMEIGQPSVDPLPRSPRWKKCHSNAILNHDSHTYELHETGIEMKHDVVSITSSLLAHLATSETNNSNFNWTLAHRYKHMHFGALRHARAAALILLGNTIDKDGLPANDKSWMTWGLTEQLSVSTEHNFKILA